MLKRIVIMLLLGTSLAYSQNFTNTVDLDLRQQATLSYAIPGRPEGNVDQPLTLWFSYSGEPQNLSGTLRHSGVTYSLFENYTPSASPIQISPINDFLGEPQAGAWVFHVSTDNPFTINQWGVSQVPEPSSFALMGLGVAALLIFRRKN